jgi:biotin-(acetyl-CoA carboxylase) ligase
LEAALPDQWLVRVQRLLLWLGERVTLTDGETGVQGRLTGLTREGTIVLDVDGRSMEFAGGTLRR